MHDNQKFAVGLILLVALALRLWPVNFGLPALNDPDELMFELGAVNMIRTHSLNPGWFGHPATTTIYLLALVDIAVFLVGYAAGWFANPAAFVLRIYQNPSWVILPGRIVMVLFGVWTVALTARLARRVAGPEAGLAAALFLALSPLHIAWSQVVRSDIVGTAFVVLELLGAIDVMAGRGRTTRCALFCALAIASKWPFGIVALAVPAALVWCWHTRRMTAQAALRAGALFVGGVPVLLVLIAPYLLIAHGAVLRDLAGEAQIHHLGATGSGPLANAWWYCSRPLITAIGEVGIAFGAGGLWVLRRAPECRVVLLPVLFAFLAIFSFQHLVWDRWMLPLLPVIAVFSGCGLISLHLALAPIMGRAASLALVWAAAAMPLIMADVGAARERADNTAQQATRWAIAHIPTGSSVLVEHFAFDLLPQPWHLLFPFGNVGCVDPRVALAGKIDHHSISVGRGTRSNVDYGTVAAAQRQTCRADYAILTQFDRYQAERAEFPDEYAAYRDYMATGRVIATFRPVRGLSGGRIVRIVKFNHI